MKTHCKHGHERTPDNLNLVGACVKCQSLRNEARRGKRKSNVAYMKKYYAANREEQLIANKLRYENDVEFRNKAIARSRRAALKKLGWTPELVEESKVLQENCCAICRIVFDRTPHADHDHETQSPRGLLCGTCNQAIGLLQDNSRLCEAAAAYLRKWERNG